MSTNSSSRIDCNNWNPIQDSDSGSIIYLIRHGESLGNVNRRVLTPNEDILTEAGIEQVNRLGNCLSDINFSHAFSSDFKRAVDTANAVLSNSKHPTPTLQQDVRLRERFFGEFEGKSYQEGFMRFKKDKDQGICQGIFDFEIVDGETNQTVSHRMVSFLKDLCNFLDCADYPQNVMMVSHSYAIITMFHYLMSSKSEFVLKNWDSAKDFKVMGNACFMKIKVIKKKENNDPRILHFISTFEGGHLDGMLNHGSLSEFTKTSDVAKDFQGCTQQ